MAAVMAGVVARVVAAAAHGGVAHVERGEVVAAVQEEAARKGGVHKQVCGRWGAVEGAVEGAVWGARGGGGGRAGGVCAKGKGVCVQAMRRCRVVRVRCGYVWSTGHATIVMPV